MAINQRDQISKPSDITLSNANYSHQINYDFTSLYQDPQCLSKDTKKSLLINQVVELFKEQFAMVKETDSGLAKLQTFNNIFKIQADYLVEGQLDPMLKSCLHIWSNLNGSPQPLMIGDALTEKMFFSTYNTMHP